MGLDDLLRRARWRGGDDDATLARDREDQGDPNAVYFGRVYDAGDMPTASPGKYATHPVRYTHPEREGEPVVAVVDTDRTVYVIVWNRVPAVGDDVLAVRQGGFWHAEQGPPTDPCHSWFCLYVMACGGLPKVGADVTVTGPDGFSKAGVTNSAGQCCLSLGGAGSYTATATDGEHTASTTFTHDGTCRSLGRSVCLGGGMWLDAEVKGYCIGSGWPGYSQFPDGIPLEIKQTVGGVEHVRTVTTDAAGKWSGCLEYAAAGTVRVAAPPCPWTKTPTFPWPPNPAPFSGPFGTCGKVTVRAGLEFDQAVYECNTCEKKPIPWDGYLVTLACGATVTMNRGRGIGPAPPPVCVVVPTDKLAYAYYVVCPPYGWKYVLLRPSSGNTGIFVSRLACDYSGTWKIRIGWVMGYSHDCTSIATGVPTGQVYGAPGPSGCSNDVDILRDPIVPPGSLAYLSIGAAMGFDVGISTLSAYVETDVILESVGGTPTSLTLQGTLDDVFVPGNTALFPGNPDYYDRWYTPPCKGPITVTRTWCEGDGGLGGDTEGGT